MMKIEKDLEQNKDNDLIAPIARKLIENSKIDPTLIQTLNKENKSLIEMGKYVKSEARKRLNSKDGYIDPEIVYGWAQHYYDEDSILMGKPEIKKVEEVSLPDESLDDFDF